MGRPQLTLHGLWMAAVLCCGAEAVLSHGCAAAVLEIWPLKRYRVEVSVPAHVTRRPAGIVVHRRAVLTPKELTRHDGIPVTSPICTLIDLAARIGREQLEAAINEADKLGLVDPEELRHALDHHSPPARPRRPA